MNSIQIKYPLLAVGRGPWRILAECPAKLHNTVRAVRGASTGGVRCICPRGIDLWQADLKRERERKQALKHGISPKPHTRKVNTLKSGVLPSYLTNIGQNVRPPEMPTGERIPCRWPSNRAVVDRAIAATRGPAVRAAQALCEQCPIASKQECLRWITDAEEPAGSWGGVYAGLTAADRKRAALDRMGVA